jgi:roadblock/LC7 domain-containing protein
VWEASSGQELHTLEGHTGVVAACTFSPDGSLILSGNSDMSLKVWEAATMKELRTLFGHTGAIEACAFSPDGRFVISTSDDDSLRVWNQESGEFLACLPLQGPFKSPSQPPSNRQVVHCEAGGADDRIGLMGQAYGPLIVTAFDEGMGPALNCPACQGNIQIKNDLLGCEITCPRLVCGTRLKVNPFVVHRRR